MEGLQVGKLDITLFAIILGLKIENVIKKRDRHRNMQTDKQTHIRTVTLRPTDCKNTNQLFLVMEKKLFG